MSFLTSLSGIFSDDPSLRMIQMGLLVLGILIVFLLLFATRDILLRTRSFAYQFACILLVALLPGIGFLLYLLIRPARTLKERELEARIEHIEESLSLLPSDEEFADEELEGIGEIQEMEELAALEEAEEAEAEEKGEDETVA